MKALLTAEEIVAHMEEKGILFNIESKEDALSFLQSSNYYMKLGSYRQNFKKYTSVLKKDNTWGWSLHI